MDNLNQYNIKITRADVENILKRGGLNIPVINMGLYQEAFTHRSYVMPKKNKRYSCFARANNIVEMQPKSYDTLEFYGDSIVASSAVEYLYKRFPKFNEGELTKLKNTIVSSVYLSKFARHLDFQPFVLMSTPTEIVCGRSGNNIMEDCYEAFVGAIAIDCNHSSARKFVTKSIDTLVDFGKLLSANANYKDRILNYYQINGWHHPIYQTDIEIGSQHKKTFVVNLLRKHKKKIKSITKGVGKTKKAAEMNASYNALYLFNLLEPHEIKNIP